METLKETATCKPESLILISVEIANSLDDHTRVEILTCLNSDLNVLNNLGEIASQFIELSEWSNEYILRVTKIKPVNISSDKKSSDIVSNLFNN